ncbi:MAG: ABC transporter permease [Oscillospiraceae bacterium]
MKKYVFKRILTGLFVVAIVFVINFVIVRLAPGDPVSILAGRDNPSQELMDNLNEKYGFDQPMHIQFIRYIKNMLKGDFGNSVIYNEGVLKLIFDKMGASLLLALSAIVLALIIGTAIGLYAATHQNGWFDKIFTALSYVLNSMPSFWLAIMFIMVFATNLGWVPTSGISDLRNNYTGIRLIVDVLWHLLMPVMTLTLIQLPVYFKIARSSVLQVMSEDFITTFRATGMSEKKIYNKYVFKNAILPVVTVFGISLAFVITGSVLVETVFSWPGTGRLMMTAIMNRDYPLIMGIYLILSLSISIMMIIVDLIYAYIDPRIRNSYN